MDRPRIKTKHPGIYYRLRGDGSKQYCYWFTGTDGRGHWQNTAGGLKEAKRERAKIINAMARGQRVAPTRQLFADFARAWMKRQPNLSPNTVSTWEGMIKNHLIPRLGPRTKLQDVDVNLVASLIEDMRSEGLKANTINTALAPLNKIMASAVRLGVVAVNPVSQLEKSERPRGDQAKMNILDTDEITLLLNEAKDYRLIFATAIFTGLRISELLALTWDDVDWDSEHIVVRKAKTRAGTREVVLMPALRQQLAAHSLEHDTTYVFGGDKPLHRSTVGKAFRATLKRAGITKRVRFHDLRHTFASILIHQGCSDTYIAEQMGHTSGSFTRQTYGHLFDGNRQREEAREKMESTFGGVLG